LIIAQIYWLSNRGRLERPLGFLPGSFTLFFELKDAVAAIDGHAEPAITVVPFGC